MVQREVRTTVVPSAHLPLRTCVGCRVITVASGLLRVVAQGSHVVPDPRRRLPGRGAWLHPTPECLALAERRKAFPRALRTGQLDTSAVSDHLGRSPGDERQAENS